MIKNALIISYSEKSAEHFTGLLSLASVIETEFLKTCAEARRLLLERDFDLVIINAPLPDETGESLARHIAAKGISQVILVVKYEYFDAVCAVCEDSGILTVAKPLNKEIFWSALSLAKAAQSKKIYAQTENAELQAKIENIRTVDRAKKILMTYMNMSEKEAHRHIEKEAMDMRTTKKAVAEKVIKTYEN